MTAVLVHGVPETPSVWHPLVDALQRDDVALLQLPGFGCRCPEGFDATKEHYAEWMAGELRSFDEVDLVTHDWAALLTLRVLADQPANVRSWTTDMGDLGEDFRWHDTARVWQTQGEGEALMEGMVGADDATKAGFLMAVGVPEQHAPEMARHLDRAMGEAILSLYRSATEIGIEWNDGIDEILPHGMIVESGRDPFRSPHRARRLAERTGARLASLPEAGHFWMLEDPAGVASLLEGFWADLD